MPYYRSLLEHRRGIQSSCASGPAINKQPMDAYLDIETTGLSLHYDRITVIGIGLAKGRGLQLVQLYGSTLTRKHLADTLEGISQLYTYNGGRFDLPFIHQRLGLDIAAQVEHHDLMHYCWQERLYGGLKAVEVRLGISRESAGMTGLDAVELWRRYESAGNKQALKKLLAYNGEDVSNLRVLRRKLGNNR